MHLSGLACRVIIAAVLILAAIGKLNARSAFADSLAALGMHGRLAWWLGVCLVEFSVASAMVLNTSPIFTGLATVIPGAIFAVAGALAIARGGNITCACFGASSKSALGRQQLTLFPVWAAAAMLIALAGSVNDSERLVMLMLVIVITMGARSVQLVRVVLNARQDRIVMAEIGSLPE